MLGWTINPEKLRDLREDAQKTPAEMAELVGCHTNTWRNLERGQQPGPKLTWAITNAFTELHRRKITLAAIAIANPDDLADVAVTINPRSLRALREQAQLTPAELAALAGCSPGTYRNLERGVPPGPKLTGNIVAILSERLGRKITMADIATPRERTRRKPATEKANADSDENAA